MKIQFPLSALTGTIYGFYLGLIVAMLPINCKESRMRQDWKWRYKQGYEDGYQTGSWYEKNKAANPGWVPRKIDWDTAVVPHSYISK